MAAIAKKLIRTNVTKMMMMKMVFKMLEFKKKKKLFKHLVNRFLMTKQK